jgi:beta-lactamase regulating signal transducer with metallopeptidase domain
MIYTMLAYFGIKALIVSVIGLLAQLLLRRASASTRHAVAYAFLGTLFVLPVAAWYGPHFAVDTPKPIARTFEYPVQPKLYFYEQAQTRVITPAATESVYATTDYVTGILGWTYLVVCALLLFKLALGLVLVLRLKAGASALEEGVLLSDRAKVPMTIWAGRSTILLPSEAPSWERERLARVLAHERAHIRRRDLFWNLLGQLACAAYWPLPTVWGLQGIARNASEQACDDIVLTSGVEASEYAQDLLEVARTVSAPTLALPIVDKANVGKRIVHVLDQGARRSGATVALAMVTSAITLSLSIPVAIVGFRYIDQVNAGGPLPTGKRRVIYASSQANPTSWASPGSDAGTPENGFVGTIPDKRKVQFLQVQRVNGKTFEAWKPDGTPIKNPQNFGGGKWMTAPNRLVMVVRFETPNTSNCAGAGLGSGPHLQGDTEEQESSGGIILPPSEKGWRTELAYIEIGGAMTTSSYTFAISDEKVKTLATITLLSDALRVMPNPSLISNVSFDPHLKVSIPNRNAKGELVKEQGRIKNHFDTRPALTFSALTHPPLDSVVAYAYDKKGVRYMGVVAPAGQGQYFNVPVDQLDHFEIVLNRMQAVDLLHVHLSPKSPSTP